MHPMPSAGNYTICTKRGKPCTRCQAREIRQPLLSAGNPACTRCQAREITQSVPHAGKRAPGGIRYLAREKSRIGFGFGTENERMIIFFNSQSIDIYKFALTLRYVNYVEFSLACFQGRSTHTILQLKTLQPTTASVYVYAKRRWDSC